MMIAAGWMVAAPLLMDNPDLSLRHAKCQWAIEFIWVEGNNTVNFPTILLCPNFPFQ
jgi:hypothetical protein